MLSVMKARLPQGYGGGGAANLQQLARQAQKMQEQMEAVTAELEEKEYSATSGGDAVKATVTGKLEVKSVEIKPCLLYTSLLSSPFLKGLLLSPRIWTSILFRINPRLLSVLPAARKKPRS